MQRQHSEQRAEDDRHRWPDLQGQLAGSGVGRLLGHLAWSTSGGLFQGIDNLLKDVRAVIGYLLENGVGKLLELGTVPFNLLQLTLKLKGKGELGSGVRAGIHQERQTDRADLPHQNNDQTHTLLDSPHENKAQRSQVHSTVLAAYKTGLFPRVSQTLL